MDATAIERYVAAFDARCAALGRPGRMGVDGPGVRGLVAKGDEPFVRLLVTDDRAYDTLAALLRRTGPAFVNVLAAAPRAAALLTGAGWDLSPVTAMVHADLRGLPAVPLPRGLALRRVRRGDAPGDVSLDDAVTVALEADPRDLGSPDVLAGVLRSLPPAFRLLAAVDGDGVVRGTGGAGALGEAASVVFVNTDPAWRGRGVASAMTAAAVATARDRGARFASLDATEAAVSLYRRLGFVTATTATHCSRS